MNKIDRILIEIIGFEYLDQVCDCAWHRSIMPSFRMSFAHAK